MNEPSPNSAPETPFLSAAPSTGLLIAGITTGFLTSGVFALASYLTGHFFGSPALADILMRMGLLVGTALLILPGWLYTRSWPGYRQKVFRLRPVSRALWASSLMLGAGLVILTDSLDRQIAPAINHYLDSTLGQLAPELRSDRILEKLAEEMKFKSFFSGFILIAAAIAAAAICEEMLVRGMFQGSLEKKLHPALAVLISSAAFAIMHFNPWGGIQIFIIALALGIVAWVSGSIIPTMIIHGLNNLTVILANNLEVGDTSWYGDAGGVNLWVVFGGTILLMVGFKGLWANRPVNPMANPHSIA